MIRVTDGNKKAAAVRLAELLATTANYTRAPRFAYEVSGFFFEKDGTVTVPELADIQPIRKLAAEGLVEPFDEAPAADPGDDRAPESAPTDRVDGLAISFPRGGFTDASLENLRKLVASKASLIRKALGAERTDIEVDDDWVVFPWWNRQPESEEVTAYLEFIAAICKMAQEAKRVTAKEAPVESEKYTFRCFLLRLGFIGSEKKTARKILLRRLSGSAAFVSKDKADAFSAAQKAKRDVAKNKEA